MPLQDDGFPASELSTRIQRTPDGKRRGNVEATGVAKKLGTIDLKKCKLQELAQWNCLGRDDGIHCEEVVRLFRR